METNGSVVSGIKDLMEADGWEVKDAEYGTLGELFYVEKVVRGMTVKLAIEVIAVEGC